MINKVNKEGKHPRCCNVSKQWVNLNSIYEAAQLVCWEQSEHPALQSPHAPVLFLSLGGQTNSAHHCQLILPTAVKDLPVESCRSRCTITKFAMQWHIVCGFRGYFLASLLGNGYGTISHNCKASFIALKLCCYVTDYIVFYTLCGAVFSYSLYAFKRLSIFFLELFSCLLFEFLVIQHSRKDHLRNWLQILISHCTAWHWAKQLLPINCNTWLRNTRPANFL